MRDEDPRCRLRPRGSRTHQENARITNPKLQISKQSAFMIVAVVRIILITITTVVLTIKVTTLVMIIRIGL